MKIILKALSIVLGFSMLFGIVYLGNKLNPPKYMSNLEDSYWAGYYETNTFGKIWCLVKFYKDGSELKMIVLSVSDTKDYFLVERNGSDDEIVKFTMKPMENGATIIADQLYLGQRNVIGRLLSGRFKDFWKKNTDDSIRGFFTYPNQKLKFEIERIEKDRLVDFYNKLVLKEAKYSTSDQIDNMVASSIERKLL
jgi:hypothetical protein